MFKRGHGLKKVADTIVDDMAVDDQDDVAVTDPEEVLANKIKDTVEYLIRHDRAEIKELLAKFQDYDENYENDVIRLSQPTCNTRLLDEAIIGLSCVCVCVHVFRREKILTGKPC